MTNNIIAQFCSTVLRKAAFALCVALWTLGLGFSASAQELRITTFDVPGAGTSAFQGTSAIAINPLGVIAG